MVARNVYQRTISNWPGRSTKNSFEKIHFSLSLSLSAPFFEFYGGRFFFVVVGWDILFWQRCIGKREIRQKKKKKKGTDNLRLPSTRRFYDATAEFCLHDSTEASCSSATPVPPVFPSSLFFFGSLPFYLILSFLYSVAFCSCVYLSLSDCVVAHQKIIIVVIKTGRTKHTFFWENRVPSVGLENHQSRQNKRRREGHVSGHWRNTKAEPTHFGRRA